MAEYNLGTAHGTVKIDSDTTGVDQAGKALGNLDKNAKNSGVSISKVGTGMALAGGVIAGGFAVAAKTAMDFESQLSGIRAVSGATAGQMDLIRDAALRIGKDTSFSASEAAAAMEELVKAGIPVDDVLNGAADATVALAAATGVDMPTAAGIASNAMNVFGIKAQDMDRVVNTFAQTANASAIDVTDLGMAMSQVGAVANLAGLSMEDTTKAIGQLGDAGIKGSDAGTSLKTMLMNLQPTTEKAATAMSDLGIITEDGTNRFYDQNGKLKSLRDIQQILNDSTKDLSQAQKQQALETIFGSDAIRAAAVLADGGAASYDNFGKKMAGSGTAAEQAKIRQDNMKGSLEQLKGSLETVGISIGTVLIPPLKTMIDFIGGLVDWFGQLSPTTQNVIISLVALAGGLLLLGAGIIKAVEFAKSFYGALQTLRIVSSATSSSFVVDAGKTIGSWIATAAAAVANAAATAAAWAVNAAKVVAQFALMALQAGLNAAKVAAAWLITNGVAMASALASMAVAVATTVAGWIVMAVTAAANAIAIAAAWFIALGPIGWAIAALIAVVAFVIIFWDDVVKWFKAGAEKVAQWMRTAWEWIVGVWNSIKSAFSSAGAAVGQMLVNLGNSIRNIWNSIISWLRGIPGWVIGIFASAAGWLINAGRNILNGLWNGIRAIWSGVVSWLGGVGRNIIGIFAGAGSWLWNAGINLLQGLWNGISSGASWLYSKVKNWASNLVDSVLGFFGINSPSRVFAEIGDYLMQGLGKGIDNGAGGAMSAATSAAADVVNAMQAGLAAGADLQATVGASLTDGTRAALAGGVPSLGATAATAVTGSSPMLGGRSTSQAATDAAFQKIVNMEFNSYNPLPEKASDNEARKIRAAAAVGAF